LFKESRETIALFGGSFDPPHLGHKSVVEEALKSLEINKIVVVPTFLNPFKQSSYLTAIERFLLVKNMFLPLEKVEVSSFEIEREASTPSFITLKYFQKKYEVKYFIIGADNLENIEKWHEFEWLNSQITWVIATRNGYALRSDKLRDFKILNIEVDISSTEIRNNIIKESS